MLVELLRPVGPELARRWLAALTLVDADEREAMVAMIERQIAEVYGNPAARAAEPVASKSATRPDRPAIQVVHPPVQRDGHIEQVVTTYEVMDPSEHEAQQDERNGTIRDKPRRATSG